MEKIKSSLKIDMTGFVTYNKLRNIDGIWYLEESPEGNNLVVDLSKDHIMSLFVNATSGKRITKMGFGSNSASVASTDTEETFSNLFLNNLHESPTIDYTNKTITFEWALNAYEFNGYNLCEVGLFTHDGELVARKLITESFIKESDIMLEGSWVLSF